VPLTLPALRERRGDVPPLAAHFLAGLQEGLAEVDRKTLSPEAVEALSAHSWKGNVRELRNVLMRSLLFAPGAVITPKDILFLNFEERPEWPVDVLKGAERDALVKALRENGWNKRRTADALGVAKSTLFEKIRKFGIKDEE
jgi:DNA-binding NtrC family response regulator